LFYDFISFSFCRDHSAVCDNPASIIRFLIIIYSLLAELMKLGTTDLDAAPVMPRDQSLLLVDDSVARFGRELTHVFVVILSVLLDDGVFGALCQQAEHVRPEISDSSSITLKVCHFGVVVFLWLLSYQTSKRAMRRNLWMRRVTDTRR
jgi:hypothetical protein